MQLMARVHFGKSGTERVARAGATCRVPDVRGPGSSMRTGSAADGGSNADCIERLSRCARPPPRIPKCGSAVLLQFAPAPE